MANRYIATLAVLTTCVTLAVAAAPSTGSGQGQQPRITNGQISTRPATAGLVRTFQATVAAQTDVAWIGYAVPVKDRDRVMCCWSIGNSHIEGSVAASEMPCCGFCRIEPSAGSTARAATPPAASVPHVQSPVKLEGSGRMMVLFRVADRQVERVRVFSEECELDAGGRPVHWLDGVQPGESIALLESLVGSVADRKSKMTNGALNALAEHDEPAAAAALERLARAHVSPGVRGDALFWLAQKAGRKAAAAITEAIEKDPETEVKRRAVFALSQLPRDEGVPLLIDIARKNPNPVVRKQAIFWLGQSKDPRAIDFFAEILK